MQHIRIIIVLCCVLLNACAMSATQIGNTQNFGLATEKIGSVSENEMIAIRAGIVEMNKALVILDRSKNSQNLDFDKPTFAAPTAVRVSACKALRHYGDLLVHLASDDRALSIRKSAIMFMDNVNEATGETLTSSQESILSTIITGFGYYWTEKAKAEAVAKIVTEYEPVVDRLADLLMADFSLEDTDMGFLKAYQITAKRLQNSAMLIIDGGEEYDLLEREKAVQAYFMGQTALVRSKEIGATMTSSILELKKANHAMATSIAEHGYNIADFKEFGKQIQKVNTMQKVLN